MFLSKSVISKLEVLQAQAVLIEALRIQLHHIF
jgi:hypothetical protein